MSRALRRVGPMVILRERVLTSGRKARTHDLFELLAPVGLLLRYGPPPAIIAAVCLSGPAAAGTTRAGRRKSGPEVAVQCPRLSGE